MSSSRRNLHGSAARLAVDKIARLGARAKLTLGDCAAGMRLFEKSGTMLAVSIRECGVV
jgi:hypothetical protein